MFCVYAGVYGTCTLENIPSRRKGMGEKRRKILKKKEEDKREREKIKPKRVLED
jgi:hypothetical protein